MKVTANSSTEDKKLFKEIYSKGDHLCVTNARGFWEKAPKNPALLMLVFTHVLINVKHKDIVELLINNPKTEVYVSTKIKKPFLMHLEPHFFETYNEELTYEII